MSKTKKALQKLPFKVNFLTVYLLLCIAITGALYLKSNIFFRLALVRNCLKNNDYEKIIVTYNKIIRKAALGKKVFSSDDDFVFKTHIDFAQLLLKRQRFNDSARVLKQLYDLSSAEKVNFEFKSTNVEYYRRFGISLARYGLYELAIKNLLCTLQYEPNDATTYYYLGLLHARIGKEDDAVSYLQRSISIIQHLQSQSVYNLPSCLGDAYYRLALLAEKEGNKDNAISYYENALQVSGPWSIEACYRLMSIYEKEDNYEKAAGAGKRLEELSPQYKFHIKLEEGISLSGISIKEDEFNLFNEGAISFFFESEKPEAFSRLVKNGTDGIYGIGRHFYLTKTVRNLVSDFNLPTTQGKTLPLPLIDQGRRGLFSYETDTEARTVSIIARQPDKLGKWEIQCGYTAGKNGFNPNIVPGQIAIFALSASLSDQDRIPPVIYIQDHYEEWEREKECIDKTSLSRYAVLKKTRGNVDEFNFGVYWLPEKTNEFITIKDPVVLLVDLKDGYSKELF